MWIKLAFLTLTLLGVMTIDVIAEVYQWTDKAGNAHFTDNPSNVPSDVRPRGKKNKIKFTERTKNSWVMIEENVDGYAYQSFGFYDKANIQKINGNIIVPVKIIISTKNRSSGLMSYVTQIYDISCRTMSVDVQEYKRDLNMTADQFPADYRRHKLGVVHHESEIPDRMLLIMCDKAPSTNDNCDNEYPLNTNQ